MALNLLEKLDYYDYHEPEFQPKELSKDKGWKGETRKCFPIIKEMDELTYSTATEKIQTAFDKFLAEGDPKYEKLQKCLKKVWKNIMVQHGYV